MTRTLTTVLLLTATALALAADAPKAEPPFKHPRAVQAWKRWQYRSDQLRQQYERALAEERKAYLDGLEEAAKAAAQTGALDEVKAIAEVQGQSDSILPDMIHGTRWMADSGDTDRNMKFMADGKVLSGADFSAQGQWEQIADRVIIARWRGWYVVVFNSDMRTAKVYAGRDRWTLKALP